VAGLVSGFRVALAAHRREVGGEPVVLVAVAGGADVEARVVDGAGQRAAADGLVRGQHRRVDQAELEPGRKGKSTCLRAMLTERACCLSLRLN